jgi:hypothetical protein
MNPFSLPRVWPLVWYTTSRWIGPPVVAGVVLDAKPRRKYSLTVAAIEQRRAAGRASWKASVNRAYAEWLYEVPGRAGGVARAENARRREDGVFL